MSQLKMKGATIDATGYVINPDIKLPSWLKCKQCGKPPTATDWLKPLNPSENCREFIHLSHIPNGPQLSLEAGFIARNS